jgi:hypothetical protein
MAWSRNIVSGKRFYPQTAKVGLAVSPDLISSIMHDVTGVIKHDIACNCSLAKSTLRCMISFPFHDFISSSSLQLLLVKQLPFFTFYFVS